MSRLYHIRLYIATNNLRNLTGIFVPMCLKLRWIKLKLREGGLEGFCQRPAITQIKEKYLKGVDGKFPDAAVVAMYGIAFYKKECKVSFECVQN